MYVYKKYYFPHLSDFMPAGRGATGAAGRRSEWGSPRMTSNWGRRVEGLRLDVAKLRGLEARAFSSGVRARLVLIIFFFRGDAAAVFVRGWY